MSLASMGRDFVDCDVHCSVPDIQVLFPYMSSLWRDRVLENGFRGPGGAAHCYPPAISGTSIASPDALNERVLSNAHLQALVLNCYYSVEMIRNPDLSAQLAAAVNRWLEEEWLSQDSRTHVSITIAVQNPELAASEIRERAKNERFVQVAMPVHAERPYGNRSYFPIYAAAEEHGLPIGLHYGGVSGSAPTPSGWPTLFLEEWVGASHQFQTQLLSMIAEGVFNEFPRLRVVLLESGVSFLPSLMWRLDKEWKGFRREVPWVRDLPSTYIRQRVRATTQPFDLPSNAEQATQVLHALGSPDLLLFSTDEPHDHGAEPDAFLDLLTEPDLNAVLLTNPQSTYRLS